MNSRERVYAALRHEEVDRVPIFMWFHPETAKHLSELLEILSVQSVTRWAMISIRHG